ncbi:MAG: hypothetical protein ThorAB25_12330 [Candidatus Thorarchaeota archaeon AB_25]|jgi:hypothetical protein|nr:MAG: hypothetical protein ThorAB25_12330 [Candidatus Thorarchaeota archaeon AB_25]
MVELLIDFRSVVILRDTEAGHNTSHIWSRHSEMKRLADFKLER